MIQRLTFEVIEDGIYGAQVIHQKPLSRYRTPASAARRSFLHPEGMGTCICAEKGDIRYPSILVLKGSAVLLQLHT
jgi:hypothetical protein